MRNTLYRIEVWSRRHPGKFLGYRTDNGREVTFLDLPALLLEVERLNANPRRRFDYRAEGDITRAA